MRAAAGKEPLFDRIGHRESPTVAVGVLESGKLPVRMPIYIAIVALARYLILDMKDMDTWRVIGISGAALVLAFTVLVIRFGHIKFPYGHHEDDG